MLSEMPAAGKTQAEGEFASNARLYDLLIALGFFARERVSVCTKLPGSPFVSDLNM